LEEERNSGETAPIKATGMNRCEIHGAVQKEKGFERVRLQLKGKIGHQSCGV